MIHQGGPYFEVFCSQGQKPLEALQVVTAASVHQQFTNRPAGSAAAPARVGSAAKRVVHAVYDKLCKSQVVVVEGTTTKVTFAGAGSSSRGGPRGGGLRLMHPVLVFQLFVPAGAPFCLELSIADDSGVLHRGGSAAASRAASAGGSPPPALGAGTHRRLVFSTSVTKTVADQFTARFPVGSMPRNCWMYLVLDMHSIVNSRPEQQQQHRGPPAAGGRVGSIDGITLQSPGCRVRRVFTLESLLSHSIYAHHPQGHSNVASTATSLLASPAPTQGGRGEEGLLGTITAADLIFPGQCAFPAGVDSTAVLLQQGTELGPTPTIVSQPPRHATGAHRGGSATKTATPPPPSQQQQQQQHAAAAAAVTPAESKLGKDASVVELHQHYGEHPPGTSSTKKRLQAPISHVDAASADPSQLSARSLQPSSRSSGEPADAVDREEREVADLHLSRELPLSPNEHARLRPQTTPQSLPPNCQSSGGSKPPAPSLGTADPDYHKAAAQGNQYGLGVGPAAGGSYSVVQSTTSSVLGALATRQLVYSGATSIDSSAANDAAALRSTHDDSTLVEMSSEEEGPEEDGRRAYGQQPGVPAREDGLRIRRGRGAVGDSAEIDEEEGMVAGTERPYAALGFASGEEEIREEGLAATSVEWSSSIDEDDEGQEDTMDHETAYRMLRGCSGSHGNSGTTQASPHHDNDGGHSGDVAVGATPGGGGIGGFGLELAAAPLDAPTQPRALRRQDASDAVAISNNKGVRGKEEVYPPESGRSAATLTSTVMSGFTDDSFFNAQLQKYKEPAAGGQEGVTMSASWGEYADTRSDQDGVEEEVGASEASDEDDFNVDQGMVHRDSPVPPRAAHQGPHGVSGSMPAAGDEMECNQRGSGVAGSAVPRVSSRPSTNPRIPMQLIPPAVGGNDASVGGIGARDAPTPTNAAAVHVGGVLASPRNLAVSRDSARHRYRAASCTSDDDSPPCDRRPPAGDDPDDGASSTAASQEGRMVDIIGDGTFHAAFSNQAAAVATHQQPTNAATGYYPTTGPAASHSLHPPETYEVLRSSVMTQERDADRSPPPDDDAMVDMRYRGDSSSAHVAGGYPHMVGAQSPQAQTAGMRAVGLPNTLTSGDRAAMNVSSLQYDDLLQCYYDPKRQVYYSS